MERKEGKANQRHYSESQSKSRDRRNRGEEGFKGLAGCVLSERLKRLMRSGSG
ncbi:unnamed protein product [Lathyrus oleraceus]